MRYAVLLGISIVGHGEQSDMIMVAQRVSEAHPRRVVRVIDTYTEEIRWTYRDGEPTFNA